MKAFVLLDLQYLMLESQFYFNSTNQKNNVQSLFKLMFPVLWLVENIQVRSILPHLKGRCVLLLTLTAHGCWSLTQTFGCMHCLGEEQIDKCYSETGCKYRRRTGGVKHSFKSCLQKFSCFPFVMPMLNAWYSIFKLFN